MDVETNVEEQGFALLPSVFSSDEIAAFRTRLEAAPLRRSRAGSRHALAHPAVASLARDERLLTFARRILGSDAAPFRATLFDKSLDSNWLVVWHQDTALPLCQRRDLPGWGPWSIKEGIHYAHAPASALELVLALRVHLDDSNASNGPLRVLPGTHRLGVLSDDSIERLVVQYAAFDCLVPVGGVVAMRPLIIHASSKALEGSSRRVLHLEYAAGFSVGDRLQLATA